MYHTSEHKRVKMHCTLPQHQSRALIRLESTLPKIKLESTLPKPKIVVTKYAFDTMEKAGGLDIDIGCAILLSHTQPHSARHKP